MLLEAGATNDPVCYHYPLDFYKISMIDSNQDIKVIFVSRKQSKLWQVSPDFMVTSSIEKITEGTSPSCSTSPLWSCELVLITIAQQSHWTDILNLIKVNKLWRCIKITIFYSKIFFDDVDRKSGMYNVVWGPIFFSLSVQDPHVNFHRIFPLYDLRHFDVQQMYVGYKNVHPNFFYNLAHFCFPDLMRAPDCIARQRDVTSCDTGDYNEQMRIGKVLKHADRWYQSCIKMYRCSALFLRQSRKDLFLCGQAACTEAVAAQPQQNDTYITML